MYEGVLAERRLARRAHGDEPHAHRVRGHRLQRRRSGDEEHLARGRIERHVLEAQLRLIDPPDVHPLHEVHTRNAPQRPADVRDDGVLVRADRAIHAPARPDPVFAQAHARALGAEWAGGSDEPAPWLLDAAIVFAPIGALVPAALRAIRPGGVVVCAGIHMSDIPQFPYAHLWQERMVRSVANLTRDDGVRFLNRAREVPLRVDATPFPLTSANAALAAVREGRLQGAAVLIPDP